MFITEPTGDRQRELLRVRMLVLSREDMTPARQAAEIRDAANAVIAEVEAASRATPGAGEHGAGAGPFLWVRIARLAMAADDAVTAARSGDIAALDAHLRHFDALTSAIWTVQREVYGEARGTRQEQWSRT